MVLPGLRSSRAAEVSYVGPSVAQNDQRVNSVLERLKTLPISFVNSTSGVNGVVDYALLKSTLLHNLYSPHLTGAAFASAFAALEKGEAEEMWRQSSLAGVIELLDGSCASDVDKINVDTWTGIAISCSDGAPVNEALDELRKFLVDVSDQSVFADVWQSHFECAWVILD